MLLLLQPPLQQLRRVPCSVKTVANSIQRVLAT